MTGSLLRFGWEALDPGSEHLDRLAVDAHEVLVIDYKTNRTPPARPDQVPAAHLRQMAAYGALLRQIYPGRRVRCALLWTQGPQLMPLEEAVLASHAPDAWQDFLNGDAEG